MRISAKDWKRYIDRLSAVNKKAAAQMQQYIDSHGFDDSALQMAYALATKYGEAAAAAACDMYDAVAAAQGASVAPAEPAPTASYGEVAKAVNGAKKQSESKVPDAVGRLVKQAGADTTLKNAKRDGAYFAWIPSGDTCAFCITLASRGWQRASKKTIKGDHADHIHANCDCEFAISFNGPGDVEGYDPDKYLEMYENASDGSPKDKINAMRRANYAANKDRINAQKRAAYARRSGIKYSAAAGTLPDKMKKFIPDEETRKRIIAEGIAAEHPIFVEKDDLLYKLAVGLPEEKGYYTVVLHGNPYSLIFNGEEIDADTLCAIIAQRKDYKKETDIRLISCYTGAEKDGVARYIADKLKVNVKAPDKLGIIQLFNGKYTVYSGSEFGKTDGRMVPFEYKKEKKK